ERGSGDSRARRISAPGGGLRLPLEARADGAGWTRMWWSVNGVWNIVSLTFGMWQSRQLPAGLIGHAFIPIACAPSEAPTRGLGAGARPGRHPASLEAAAPRGSLGGVWAGSAVKRP